jgi:glycosyltransferase involved in cell wall biosynthesis
MTSPAQPRPLGVRHLVPALGRIPRAGVAEGTSGLVGSAFGIARAQAARGYRAELYGWRPDDGPRRYRLDGVAVSVTPGWGWAHTPRVDGRVIAPLLAMSALDRPVDVAHVYSDPHLLLAPRVRARVLHFQTPVPDSPPPLYRRLVGRADLVVCCSDFIRRQLLSRVALPPERVAVVHNGVDLRPFVAARAADREAERRRRGIGPDEVVLLYVGAVVPEKGLLHLLRALALVRPAHPCRLAVAGGAALWPTADDPYPDETDVYTRAVRAAGKDLPVTWLGVVPQDEMPAVYALADVFICPSVWDEPFGTVNVEAMAAGTPVVASRVGGVPEAVAEDETGLLVPPADAEALAGALATLIGDPARRRRMGEAARLRAEAFTWERAAERLDTLYREVLG